MLLVILVWKSYRSIFLFQGFFCRNDGVYYLLLVHIVLCPHVAQRQLQILQLTQLSQMLEIICM